MFRAYVYLQDDGGDTRALAASPDGSRLYWVAVVNARGGGSVSSLSVCDLRNSTSVPAKTIQFNDALITGQAVSPDGSYLYVPITGNVSTSPTATLNVYDTDLNLLISVTVANEAGLLAAAVSPDGSRVYVTSNPVEPGLHYMYVINVDTSNPEKPALTVLNASNPTSVPGSSGKLGSAMAVTPNGSFVYVLNVGILADASNVAVINAADLTAIKTIEVGNAQHMAMTPDGTRLYLPRADNILTIINTADNTDTTVNPRDNTFEGDQSIYFTAESPVGLAIPPHVLKFYLTNTAFGTAPGNFVMSQSQSGQAIQATITTPGPSWYSEDPPLSGTFLESVKRSGVGTR